MAGTWAKSGSATPAAFALALTAESRVPWASSRGPCSANNYHEYGPDSLVSQCISSARFSAC